MNNSMFPKKPIIKKYKKRNSFFSNNRINTIKFPSLFHNKFINDTIAAVKTFDPDARLAVLTYGMMIMACDDYIHFKETDIVKRLMRIL